MKWPGILGTAVGADDADEPGLVVFVDRDSKGRDDIVRGLPAQLRGVGGKSGADRQICRLCTQAARTRPLPQAPHTKRSRPLPIQLGTSGGWRTDLANGYCCGGTLGALVQVNGIQYILSNYHVMEADIVSGANGLTADHWQCCDSTRTNRCGLQRRQCSKRRHPGEAQLAAGQQCGCGAGAGRFGKRRRGRLHSGNRPVVGDNPGRQNEAGGQKERPHHRAHKQHHLRAQCDDQCRLRK